jgi:hypothetical protein
MESCSCGANNPQMGRTLVWLFCVMFKIPLCSAFIRYTSSFLCPYSHTTYLIYIVHQLTKLLCHPHSSTMSLLVTHFGRS